MGIKKFDVGDRVESVVEHPDGNQRIHIGSTGLVVRTTNAGQVGVSWDDYVCGHDCFGKAQDRHGWNVLARDIRRVEIEEDEPTEIDAMALLEDIRGAASIIKQKFRVGDRVLVTDNIEIIKKDPGYAEPMLMFAGEEAIVVKVSRDDYGVSVCNLQRLTGGDCWWFSEQSLLNLEDDDSLEIAGQDISDLLSL